MVLEREALIEQAVVAFGVTEGGFDDGDLRKVALSLDFKGQRSGLARVGNDLKDSRVGTDCSGVEGDGGVNEGMWLDGYFGAGLHLKSKLYSRFPPSTTSTATAPSEWSNVHQHITGNLYMEKSHNIKFGAHTQIGITAYGMQCVFCTSSKYCRSGTKVISPFN